jgi:hypothetical protein
MNGKFLIILACWLSASLTYAQSFYVRGIVTQNNSPVPNVNVLIQVLTNDNDVPVTLTVITDSTGRFNTVVQRNPNNDNGPVKVKASLTDCDGKLISQVKILPPNAPGTDFHFDICRSNENDSCFVKILPLVSNTGDRQLSAKAFGSGPFTYQWNTGETTENITVENNKEYCVTITSANGCTASDCFLTGADSCSVRIVRLPVNGAMYLVAQPNGVAPFTYQWSNGATTEKIIPQAGERYCVTVVDSRNCQAVACEGVDSSDCKAKVLIEVIDSVRYLTAFGLGQAPFTYQWSNGETTQRILFAPNSNNCVTITDATGCTAQACFQDNNNDKCAVVLKRSLSNTGEIYLVAQANGVAPFTYEWQDGSTSDRVLFIPGVEYCVTVTDANGCVAKTCLKLNPDKPCKVNIARIAQNGSTILVAIMNPPGNVTYQWSTGETTPRITVDKPGIYCVTATNARGCEAKACITVKDSAQNGNCIPGNVDVQYSADSTEAYLNFVPQNSGNFAYQWSTGESTQGITVTQSGIYYVTVTDPDKPNCRSVFKVRVQFFKACDVRIIARPLDSLTLQLFALPIPNNGPVISYQWSTGDTTSTIQVPRGVEKYCVTITLPNCTATACYTAGNNGPRANIYGINSSQKGTALILETDIPENEIEFVLWNTGDMTETVWVNQAGIYQADIYLLNGEIETATYTVKMTRNENKAGNHGQMAYPNPTYNQLTIEFQATQEEKIQVTWFNIQGKTLGQTTGTSLEGNNKMEFSIGHYPEGIYYLHVQGETTNFVQKIVKK